MGHFNILIVGELDLEIIIIICYDLLIILPITTWELHRYPQYSTAISHDMIIHYKNIFIKVTYAKVLVLKDA